MAQTVKNLLMMRCRRPGFDAQVKEDPGEGNGNPLQYTCLENSMNREARWASAHEVSELDMTERGRMQERTEEFIDRIRVDGGLRLGAESKQRNHDNVRP